MANKDRPQGAAPFGEPLRVTNYVAAAACYPGDFLAQESGGQVTPASAGATGLIGVAASYQSTAAGEVLVWDHPDQRFVVQSDSTNPDAQTDIGLNYDIVATAANTTYKASRHELDDNTGATDSNLPLKLLGIERQVGDALGANAKCVVKINNHQLAGGTGTLGV